VAAIYRLFIDQSKAYVIQDQAIEVQQNIRNAMEILLRDIRMAGFDDDSLNSPIKITNPIVYPLQESSMILNYEYYDKTILQYQLYTVTYWRDAVSSRLLRQFSINGVAQPQEILLENVDAFTFTYGVDVNEDQAMDDQNEDGVIDENDWVTAANVGTSKVVTVRVSLTASPDQTNEDVRKTIFPRNLTSAVAIRNQWFR
jgi:Tfp pilus assembly protein PilW